MIRRILRTHRPMFSSNGVTSRFSNHVHSDFNDDDDDDENDSYHDGIEREGPLSDFESRGNHDYTSKLAGYACHTYM